MSMGPKSPHLASLQVFRGLAALGVVFYHAGLFSRRMFDAEFCGDIFRFGELGVDFFFVLSGFIIAMIHWKEAGQVDRAPRYLKRRFFRIYPLLFVVTTLKLGLTLVSSSGAGADLNASRVVSSYLMIPPPDGAFPIVTAAWTLSHEALFYGFFLLVLLLSPWVGRLILASWAVLILGVHGAGMELEGMVGFVFDNHNIEFLIGVGLSVWLTSKPPSLRALVGIGAGTVAAIVFGGSLFEPETGHDQVLAVRLLVGLGEAGLFTLSSKVAVLARRCLVFHLFGAFDGASRRHGAASSLDRANDQWRTHHLLCGDWRGVGRHSFALASG